MNWRKAIGWVALAACALPAVYLATAKQTFVSDDAYISYRYAWNLVHGDGLVWNTGQAPVEGYSNLLWVLVAAVGIALGIPVVAWCQVIGILLTTGSALAAAGCVRAVGGGRVAALGATLLVSTSTITSYWAVWGLETPLLTFLLSAGTWRALVEDAAARQRPSARVWPASIALFGLASITHVEGPLYLAIPVLLRLWRVRVDPLRRHDLLLGALLCLPAAAQLLLRVAYYGDVLPNTYYVKVGASTGPWPDSAFRYLLAAVTWNPPLGIAWAVGGVAAIVARRGALLMIGGAVACFVMVSNGDDFGQLRFITPAIPTMAAAAAAGFDAIAGWSARWAWRLAILAVAAALGGNAIRWELYTEQVRAPENGPHGVPSRGRAGDGSWSIPPQPWYQRRTQPLARALRRPPPLPATPVPWFLEYLVETVPDGESFLFLDVGLAGYTMAGNDLLDGRGLNWKAMVPVIRQSLPAGGRALQDPIATTLLAEFHVARPAVLVLQCNSGRLFGPVEAILQADGALQRDYTFVANGPYTDGRGSTCVYRRNDTVPPAKERIVQRYERLLAEIPAVDWGPRLHEIEHTDSLGQVSEWSDATAPVLGTPGSYDPSYLEAPRAGALENHVREDEKRRPDPGPTR